MGSRQSTASDERQRSSSVDAVADNNGMSAADFLQSFRHARFLSADEEPHSSSGVGTHRIRSQTHGNSSNGQRNRVRTTRRSVPVFMIDFADLKCPVCHKTVPSDEADLHLVMCLTRPRLTYNDDVLTETKGECPICLEDMEAGQNIARLPCLCIYHKWCIDDWFKRKNCCPEHPGDD